MKFTEIINIMEEWAPREASWDKDNVGLQVGSAEGELKNVLLSLDLDDKVIEEAILKDCNFIITHHPLIFSPLKKLNTKDRIPSFIAKLIKNDITVYSSHTNLDYTKDGVSFKLAEKLELQNIQFLENLYSNQYKLNVFVPVTALEKVSDAIFSMGGGIIGEYSKCSFRTRGNGTFEGSENTNPSVGEKNQFQVTDEIKLEVLTDKWRVGKILKKLNEVHPYEEIAYDLIPVANPNVNFGAGCVGHLVKALNENEFLDYISRKMGIDNFRFSRGKDVQIRKVALCGGSGIEYLNTALTKGCDAYITGDIKYHSFQDAEGKILLIDAGHCETEIYVLDEIENRLKKSVPQNIKVLKYSGSTNPVNFYNN